VEPAPIQRLSELFNGVLTLQDPRIWAAMKQLPEMQQIADATRAADSPRHGLGAFANAYLSADTVAAFYPVHSIGLGTQRVTAAGDEEYWREPCTTEYRALVFHEDWAPGAYVDASPERAHVAGWLAHLANDAATVGASATEAEICAYYEACAAACNCVMLPFGQVCALVTTRDVAEGDELLLSYGHTYWMEHGGGDTRIGWTTPAIESALASMWGGDGRDAKVARLTEKYATEVKLIEGLLAKKD